MIKIGIDIGRNSTGVALFDKGKFTEIFTTGVISCMDFLQKKFIETSFDVYLEDPNLNKTIFYHRYVKGNVATMNRGQLALLMKIAQDVGANKGAANLMIDFLKSRAIPFRTIKPTRTKLNATEFKKLTGCEIRCSQHGRDAAAIVFDNL